jgi:D-alanyl-D-alanine endopeptidase (penicillin-binding protein 7)
MVSRRFCLSGLAAAAIAISALLPVPPAHAQAVVASSAAAASAKPAAKPARQSKPAKATPPRASRPSAGRRTAAAPARPSVGQASGLHRTSDALDLKSSVALVLDQETNEVLFSKNSQAVLPIASLTKLMTALVVTEAKLPLDEVIAIEQADVDTEKGSRSRLRVGSELTREEMLHLALMSSENRAAHALGRNYPGGSAAFVAEMNRRAQELGMADTSFVEPTGLSSRNQSSARDLATLVNAAYQHEMIRRLSISPEHVVEIRQRPMQFRTTNALVKSTSWDIGLQKTGYIAEAGRCLVMQASLAGRRLIMVFLDSAGKYSRLGDAERVRRWVNASVPAAITPPAPNAQL